MRACPHCMLNTMTSAASLPQRQRAAMAARAAPGPRRLGPAVVACLHLRRRRTALPLRSLGSACREPLSVAVDKVFKRVLHLRSPARRIVFSVRATDGRAGQAAASCHRH